MTSPNRRIRALLTAFVFAGLPIVLSAQSPLTVASPDGRTQVTVALDSGVLHYAVRHAAANVVMPSRLGFAFKGAAPLGDSLRIVANRRASYDSTWTQPWGEVRTVRDHHNELQVDVAESKASGRRFTVTFRVFDDGLGFRYEIPDQPGITDYEISDELTEFALADNASAWWIASNRPRLDRSEQLYSEGPVSTLDSVQTPLTMKMSNGTYVVIHEANLVDYPRMFLAGPRMESRVLRAALAPWADGVKVRGRTPLVTPWRTLQIADGVEALQPQLLTLNLNPPSRIADASWIVPQKYVGIWWWMHLTTKTWSSGPRHGATTANTRQYIDFAAANGFKSVLVEGWNVGWDGDWIHNQNAFNFTKPYPDYDLTGLAAYAKSKGVGLVAHNETSGGIENYERQLEDAYKLYQSLGIHAIKTGYVADTVGGGNSHYGQYAVRHHRKVIETAAKYGIMVDAHEPIHDTGERRTWPNMMSREGARGQEYNAWSGDGGNPPEHESMLFFTRMLAGPMDFTPGIFDLFMKSAGHGPRPPEESRPKTTLAKQLALYVVLYSPLQMAADLPENYAGQPAFQFVKDVAVDWDTTRVLQGAIGDYVLVARRQRGAPTWFLGAISDEEARTFTVPLDFLTPGKRYEAEIYADGPGANWRSNPLAITISRRPVTSATRLTVALAPGGGQAIRIRQLP